MRVSSNDSSNFISSGCIWFGNWRGDVLVQLLKDAMRVDFTTEMDDSHEHSPEAQKALLFKVGANDQLPKKPCG